MDYLHSCVSKKRSSKSKGSDFLPLYEIFKPDDYDKNKVRKPQINKIIELANTTLSYIQIIIQNPCLTGDEKRFYSINAKEELLYEINRMKINEHTIYRLLYRLETQESISVKNILFYILFNYKNNVLTNLLNNYNRINTYLTEDKHGEIIVYGRKFTKST